MPCILLAFFLGAISFTNKLVNQKFALFCNIFCMKYKIMDCKYTTFAITNFAGTIFRVVNMTTNNRIEVVRYMSFVFIHLASPT